MDKEERNLVSVCVLVRRSARLASRGAGCMAAKRSKVPDVIDVSELRDDNAVEGESGSDSGSWRDGAVLGAPSSASGSLVVCLWMSSVFALFGAVLASEGSVTPIGQSAAVRERRTGRRIPCASIVRCSWTSRPRRQSCMRSCKTTNE